MTSLEKMAVGYRIASAQLAKRIQEKQEAGAPAKEIQKLRAALNEMRVVQRCLAHYYDMPRPPEITMSQAKARGASKDDH